MNVNYHTHTSRCGHAYGTDEQYVKAAIEAGFEVLGFSDHVPFAGVHAPIDRMDMDQMEEYIQSILNLKEKYASEIQIKLGFEIEYYPQLESYYQNLKSKVDYLLLGQHYKYVGSYGYDMYTNDEDLETYVQQVCAGMRSGLVQIFAHPEYFMLGRKHWNEACIQAAHAIGKCAQETGVALEINLNGIRFGRQHYNGIEAYPYPFMPFWKIMAQYQITTVYGLDAHRPLTLLESHRMDLFKEDFKELGIFPNLNYRF